MSLIVNDDMDPFYKELEQSAASKVFDVFWKFADLEDQIDLLIVDYYIGSSDTTRASEFLDDILRNDTMSFNSKVRILGSIAEHNEVKLDSRDLHACRDLRNRFAHGRYSCIDEEDLKTGETLPMYFQNKSGEKGQRDTIDRSHSEFVKHYSTASSREEGCQVSREYSCGQTETVIYRGPVLRNKGAK